MNLHVGRITFSKRKVGIVTMKWRKKMASPFVKSFSSPTSKSPAKIISTRLKDVQRLVANSATNQLVSCLSIYSKFVNFYVKLLTDFFHFSRTLLNLIKSAKKSIDICVYCISCHEIVDEVLKRHKVGVKVRLITDKEMEQAHGSQSHRFMKNGNSFSSLFSLKEFNI